MEPASFVEYFAKLPTELPEDRLRNGLIYWLGLVVKPVEECSGDLFATSAARLAAVAAAFRSLRLGVVKSSTAAATSSVATSAGTDGGASTGGLGRG